MIKCKEDLHMLGEGTKLIVAIFEDLLYSHKKEVHVESST